jgi:hypothetical protein
MHVKKQAIVKVLHLNDGLVSRANKLALQPRRVLFKMWSNMADHGLVYPKPLWLEGKIFLAAEPPPGNQK